MDEWKERKKEGRGGVEGGKVCKRGAVTPRGRGDLFLLRLLYIIHL